MKEVETGAPVGEVRLAATAFYTSDEPMTNEIFDVFGELNLPLNVYPYVREFVHSATTRMGFPGSGGPRLLDTSSWFLGFITGS